MATVSVIMPAFNVAPYIGAAIASVLAQTFQDWELLIVERRLDRRHGARRAQAWADARSADPHLPSGERRDLGGAQHRARACHRRRSSPSSTATTLWQPTYLEAQLAVFASQPEVDIVTGNGWFLGGRLHGRTARPSPDVRPQPTLTTILADETAIFIMSVFRRRVYEAIGGFDETLRSNEDYDFWLRAGVAGFRSGATTSRSATIAAATTACRRSTSACSAASCASTETSARCCSIARRSSQILERAARPVPARAAGGAGAVRAEHRRAAGRRRPPRGALRARRRTRSSASPASWRGARRGCCRAPISGAAPTRGRS